LRGHAPGVILPVMPTYGEYLRTDELLALQSPLSQGPEHDEMLFIVIHQVYELWFKQVLHELGYLERLLERNEGDRAGHTLKRILTILKVMVAQLDILETMTPLEFLSFRDRLESGSGFQSHQFRELEFALGLKDHRALERYPAGSEARRRLDQRLTARTLWDAFLHYLAANGVAVPERDLRRDVTRSVEGSPELRPALVDVYRHRPVLAELCERMVDLDEGLQEWRYRHVKMVQRTIGTRRGTGGSTGAEYLMRTLNRPLFPDLWAIRTEL
jgi:tryptophan 2,3-dioxygenase